MIVNYWIVCIMHAVKCAGRSVLLLLPPRAQLPFNTPMHPWPQHTLSLTDSAPAPRSLTGMTWFLLLRLAF